MIAAKPAVAKTGTGVVLKRQRYVSYDRIIDNFKGAGDLNGLRVNNITGSLLVRGGFRIGNASTDGKIEGVVLDVIKSDNPNNFATGIAFDETANNFALSNITILNPGQLPGTRTYDNGDGVATELGNHHIDMEHVTVINPTDAGFDHKGSYLGMDQCLTVGGRYGFRFWTGNTLGTLISRDPAKAAVNVCMSREHTKRQTLKITHLSAHDAEYGIFVETVSGAIPPDIRIGSYDLHNVAAAIKWVGLAGTVDWGVQGPPK